MPETKWLKSLIGIGTVIMEYNNLFILAPNEKKLHPQETTYFLSINSYSTKQCEKDT